MLTGSKASQARASRASPSSPRASSERRLSPSNRGLPPVCRSRTPISSASASRPRRARTNSRTSSELRPVSGQRSSEVRRSRRSIALACRGVQSASSSRQVTTIAICVDAIACPRNSSSQIESASALCRSSRKMASGPERAALARKALHGVEEREALAFVATAGRCCAFGLRPQLGNEASERGAL